MLGGIGAFDAEWDAWRTGHELAFLCLWGPRAALLAVPCGTCGPRDGERHSAGIHPNHVPLNVN